MCRRTFLQASAAFTAQIHAGGQTAPAARIRLGYDTYSIRSLRWKALAHIDYAAKLGLDTIQISSLDDYESLDPAHLDRVKAHAAAKNITIDGGIGCICPTTGSWNASRGTPEQYILQGLRVSQAVGARAMRAFAGAPADRRSATPVERHIEATVKALRSVRSQALDTGVKIAIENHGEFTARELRNLIEEAGKDFVAANLDTGNPMHVLEDPLLTLEVLGPYVSTTHIRDSALFEHPRGAAFQWVALGDGSIDFGPIVALFRRVCPHAAMQLEIITGRPPQVLPYLEQDFWRAFPKLPASDFARFTALARKGRPYMGPMMIGGTGKQPAEYDAALREQQRVDLERSFQFARRLLSGAPV